MKVLHGAQQCFTGDFCACLQKGTCIVAGGSEAQNEETQALAAQLIGCKPFNRSALHVQVSAPHLCEISSKRPCWGEMFIDLATRWLS